MTIILAWVLERPLMVVSLFKCLY